MTHCASLYIILALPLAVSIVPQARTILTSDQSKRKLRLQASITREINARRFTTRHSSDTSVDKSRYNKKNAEAESTKIRNFKWINRSCVFSSPCVCDQANSIVSLSLCLSLFWTASISSDRWMSGRSSILHNPFGAGQLMKSITCRRAQSRC